MKKLTKKRAEEINKTVNKLESLCQDTKLMISWSPTFLSEVRAFSKDKRRHNLSKIKDFVDGLFYGFPLCCVWFFVTKWPKIWREEDKKRDHRIYLGYVPCPKCYNRELKKLS